MRKSSIWAVTLAGTSALSLLLTVSAFAEDRPQEGTRRGDRSDIRVSRDGSNDRGYRRHNDTDRGDSRDGRYTAERNERHREGDRNNGYQRYTRNDSRNDGYRGGAYDRGRDRDDSYGHYRDNERVRMQGRINRYTHERGGYRVWLDNGGFSFWVPEVRWRPNWRVGINIGLGGIYRHGVIYTDVYDNPYDGGTYGRPSYNNYVSGYVDRVDYRTDTVWLRDDRSGRLVAVDARLIDPRELRPGERVTLTGRWIRGVFAADRIDFGDSRY